MKRYLVCGGLVGLFVTLLVLCTDRSSDKNDPSNAGSGSLPDGATTNQVSNSSKPEAVSTADAQSADTPSSTAVAEPDPTEDPTQIFLSETDKHKRALQAINYLNFVSAKILESNDALVLEDQYKALNVDSWNLTYIDDAGVKAQIQQILKIITALRIDVGDRQILEEVYQREKVNAIFKAFPSPVSIFSTNPKLLAVHFAQQLISGIASYVAIRGELKTKLKKDTWELDKAKLKSLDEYNRKTLEHFWDIVQRNHINDLKRVTMDEIKELTKELDKDDGARLRRWLVSNEDRFEYLPFYWYHRARIEYNLKDFPAAAYSIGKYESIRQPFLRRDSVAVEAAKLKISLLVQADTAENKRAVDKALKLIEDNSPIGMNGWDSFYYCAGIYSSYLQNHEKAAAILERAISTLEGLPKPTLPAKLEKKKDPKKIRDPRGYYGEHDALSLCRQLQVYIASRRGRPYLEKVLKQAEKSQFCNSIELLYLLQYASDSAWARTTVSNELSKISVKYEFRDDGSLSIPMRWMANKSLSILLLTGKEIDVKANEKKSKDERDQPFYVLVPYYKGTRFWKKTSKLEMPLEYARPREAFPKAARTALVGYTTILNTGVGLAASVISYSLTLGEEDRYPRKHEMKSIVSFQLHVSDNNHYLAIVNLEPENNAPFPKNGVKKGTFSVKSIVIQPIGSKDENDSGAVAYDKTGRRITLKPQK